MSWVIRSEEFGGGYWITPNLELIGLEYSDTHGDFVKRLGFKDWDEIIEQGWTRVILYPSHSELLFEARDLQTITRALSSLPPEFLSVKRVLVDATSDGLSGEIVVGEGEDALSAWERGKGKIARGMTFVATEDIETALEAWKAANPNNKIIGRDASGIWWDDGARSTHLTKWEEIRKYIS